MKELCRAFWLVEEQRSEAETLAATRVALGIFAAKTRRLVDNASSTEFDSYM